MPEVQAVRVYISALTHWELSSMGDLGQCPWGKPAATWSRYPAYWWILHDLWHGHACSKQDRQFLSHLNDFRHWVHNPETKERGEKVTAWAGVDFLQQAYLSQSWAPEDEEPEIFIFYFLNIFFNTFYYLQIMGSNCARTIDVTHWTQVHNRDPSRLR